MTWTWRMYDAEGSTVPVTAASQPTQSDAESWLGEHWRELLEQGVASVSLFEHGRMEYGPMSLAQD